MTAGARSRGFPLVARLSRVVVNGWAQSCGMTPTRLVSVLSATLALLLTGSGAAAVWLARSEAYKNLDFAVGVLPTTIVLTLFLMSMLINITAQGAGSALHPGVRSLVALPITTRLLAFSLGLPGAALTCGLLAALSPAVIVVLSGLTGYGAVHAAAAVAGACVSGLLAGRMLFTLVRRTLARSPRLVSLGLTVALGGWVLVTAISAWRGRAILGSGLDPAVLAEHAALLWPAVAAFTLDPTVLTGLLMVGVIGALVILDWKALESPASLGLAAPPLMPVRLRFSWRRRPVLFWLEIARILRHRRTVAWALSALLVFGGLLVATATVDHAGRAGIVDNAILVGCQLLGYVPLLARGMSARPLPYVMRLGFGPRAWALAVMLASGAVSLVLLVPFLVALSALGGDASAVPAGVTLMVFVIVTASIVGFAMMPGEDNSAAEFPAAAIVFAVTLVVTLGISRLIGTTDLLVLAAVMAPIAAALAWIPGALEAGRWSQVDLPAHRRT